MADDPWYRDGLRFECTRCGHCCTGAPGYVWVDEEEIRRLVAHLDLDLDTFGRRYLRRVQSRYSLLEKANGDCVFFDQGCTVYPARPRQCRSYPFWPEIIESPAAWEAECGECPGAGQGRLYPVEDIRRIARDEFDDDD